MPTDVNVDPFGFLNPVELDAALARLSLDREPRFPILTQEARTAFWGRTAANWAEIQERLLEQLWNGQVTRCVGCRTTRAVSWGFHTTGRWQGMLACGTCGYQRGFQLNRRRRFMTTVHGDRLVRSPRNVDTEYFGIGRVQFASAPVYELVQRTYGPVVFTPTGLDRQTYFRVPSGRRVDRCLERLADVVALGGGRQLDPWSLAVREILTSEMQANERCLNWSATGRRCRLSLAHDETTHRWWNGRTRDNIEWT